MKRFIKTRKLLLTVLFFMLVFQYTFYSFSTQIFHVKSETLSIGNSVWMHIDTFFQQSDSQINNFALSLKLGKIDNVFILAKNIDGTITYPSHVGIKSYSNDTMSNLISILKSNGLKIFFYFPINTDPAWLKVNIQDIAYQAGTKGSKIPVPDPAKKLVNLTSKNYRNYIIKLMNEGISKYSIDGVQLDYIRYTNGFFGFSKEELTEACNRKISTEKIIDYTYQTFLVPGDWKTILTKYDEGDSDVLAWAKLREDIIYNFTLQVVASIKNRNIQIGSTLVSSGANAKAYTAIHFGQNWENMSSILNFVTPMAYHGSREDVKKFVEEICLSAISKIKPSCKIAIGIQANETSTEKMMEAIQTATKYNLSFILFRIGTFALTNFDLVPINKQQTTLKLFITNHLEEKQIKGFMINNTGNLLSFSNLPATVRLLSQNETMANFILTNPIKFGESAQLDIPLSWNWEKSKSIFSPTIVVSDGKKVVPTLTTKYLTIDQLIIDQKKQSIEYNGQKLPKSLIKFENQKSWILISGLEQVLGYKTIILSQQIEIVKNNSRFVINQSEKKGQFFLEDTDFLINDESFFCRPGYLPLKELMNLFRINVSYNQQENIIFCTALTRDNPCSVYGKMDDMSLLVLWITDSSEVIINLDDFLTSSFYLEMSNAHLNGRSIRVIIKNSKFSIPDTEKMILLITDEKENFILPDQFSYFVNQGKDWSLIPLRREIVTNNPSFCFESRKKGYSTLLILNQTTISMLPTFTKGYYDMSNLTLIDRINLIQSESKNIKSLYFLSNLKF